MTTIYLDTKTGRQFHVYTKAELKKVESNPERYYELFEMC